MVDLRGDGLGDRTDGGGMKLAELELVGIGLGALVVAVLLYRISGKMVGVAGGALSGDNALTRSQVNAAGEPTTAYVGAGPLGTLGAAVNSATGGRTASFGESFGGWIYNVTHASDPLGLVARPAPPQMGGSTDDGPSPWVWGF